MLGAEKATGRFQPHFSLQVQNCFQQPTQTASFIPPSTHRHAGACSPAAPPVSGLHRAAGRTGSILGAGRGVARRAHPAVALRCIFLPLEQNQVRRGCRTALVILQLRKAFFPRFTAISDGCCTGHHKAQPDLNPRPQSLTLQSGHFLFFRHPSLLANIPSLPPGAYSLPPPAPPAPPAPPSAAEKPIRTESQGYFLASPTALKGKTGMLEVPELLRAPKWEGAGGGAVPWWH